MPYRSGKTYTHATGLSCCFRQWKALSHCRFLHGYALQVEVEFEADTLDDRNWVQDFGGLKKFKAGLETQFDHKTLVAEDDPALGTMLDLQRRGLAQVRVVKATGCEAFARMVFEMAEIFLEHNTLDSRVRVASATVREHAGNHATYYKDRSK